MRCSNNILKIFYENKILISDVECEEDYCEVPKEELEMSRETLVRGNGVIYLVDDETGFIKKTFVPAPPSQYFIPLREIVRIPPEWVEYKAIGGDQNDAL